AGGRTVGADDRTRLIGDLLEQRTEFGRRVQPQRRGRQLAELLPAPKLACHQPLALLFGAQPPRDIAGDRGRADDPPVVVADRRDAEGDGETSPVLADALRLEVLNALAPLEAGHDLGQLGGAVRWDEPADRLADDL